MTSSLKKHIGDREYEKFDKSKSVSILQSAHRKIHDGFHFFISGFTTLNADGTLIFSATTPNTTKWAHTIWFIQSTTTLTVEVYEEATVTGGSSVTALNSNRNSTNTSNLTILKDPTISVAGTKIASTKFGTAGTNKVPAIGGNFERENEIILKQNTTYVWKITSNADSNIIDYIAEWYELDFN